MRARSLSPVIVVGLIAFFLQSTQPSQAQTPRFDVPSLSRSVAILKNNFDRYEKSEKRLSEARDLPAQISDLRARSQSLNLILAEELSEDERAKIQTQIAEVEKDIGDHIEQLAASPTESEVETAKALACVFFQTEVAKLPSAQEPRPALPAAPTPALRTVALELSIELGRGAVCYPDSPEFVQSHTIYYTGLYLASEQVERQKIVLQDVHSHATSLAALTSLHGGVSRVVNLSGEISSELSEAGRGNIEALLQLSRELEFFKSPSQAWEATDFVKAAGGATSFLGTILYSRNNEPDTDGSPEKYLIASGIGALLFVVSDLFKAGKIPTPVASLADRVAQNRILGLAVQDMIDQLQESKRLVDQTELSSPQPAPEPIDSVAAAKPVLATTEEAIARMEDGEALGEDDISTLRSTLGAFQTGLVVELSQQEAGFLAATSRVRTAQIELNVFRGHVQAFNTAARSLRSLLGDQIESHGLCNDIYADFCALPKLSGRAEYWSVEFMKDDVVNSLISTGASLLAQFKKSDSHLTKAVEHLRSVDSVSSNAWETYANEAERLALRIQTLTAAF